MNTPARSIVLELTTSVLNHIRVQVLTVLLLALFSFHSYGQDGLHASASEYKKENKKFYKSFYKKQRVRYNHACGLLEKKRNQQPKKVFFAGSHKRKPMAETDASTVMAKAITKPLPVLQPKPKPEVVSRQVKNIPPANPKIEHISEQKLEELHKKEDDVLAKNDLPVPSSQKQAEVRKIVSDKLASKTNVYPLNLAPLYFNFDQDEFSVVDMEPFLIAAEYALQGRTVLIEGHTDSRGADDYNVKLSIKRVQKIRQLMLDMGVPDDRISIVGYGEELKTNDNKTSEGRNRNRRVDFTIF